MQQAIAFEFSFEINAINFKLKEEMAKNFDWISFKVSSFGVSIQAKTYDTYISIYLNKILCEYGLLSDVDGHKLYMISSSNQSISRPTAKSNLIDIKLVQTSAQSPTLKLLHNNVLTNVSIQLCSIDFVVNLIAIKNMLNFVETFQKNLISSDLLQYQADLEALSQTKLGNIKKSLTMNKDNGPLLNDDHIKYLLKKPADPKTAEIKSKLTELLMESEGVIELKLKANMDGFRARLCTTKQNYFKVSVESFEINAVNKGDEQNLEFVLNSICVQDMEPNAKYENIVSLCENSANLINVQLSLKMPPKVSMSSTSILATQFQKEKFYFKNYLNENHFDLIVNANISKLRLMFLYKHLNTMIVSFYFSKSNIIRAKIENSYQIKIDEIQSLILPRSKSENRSFLHAS